MEITNPSPTPSLDKAGAFQLWLKSKNYSSSTVRNYIVDVNKYFDFIGNFSLEIGNSVDLQTYIESIKNDQNRSRYLASLSKFFQFALDQKLISQNPFPQAQKNSLRSNIYDLKTILETYQQQLEAKKFSLSTIRNYINDINQFINWAQSSSGRDESRPYKNNVGV